MDVNINREFVCTLKERAEKRRHTRMWRNRKKENNERDGGASGTID